MSEVQSVKGDIANPTAVQGERNFTIAIYTSVVDPEILKGDFYW